MMVRITLLIASVPVLMLVYAYAIYPLILKVMGWSRAYRLRTDDPDDWPTVSITVPAYNEVDSIRATVERLLAIDYPPDSLQLVIVSDGSTDGTDEIVEEYASRGVELVKCQERVGKTGAENAAIPFLRGDIVINTDASVRVPSQSVKPLVRAFQDQTVGVASGFDVSEESEGVDHAQDESGYVGYEMWVRSWETKVGTIVGASGCLYGIRRSLHAREFPASLSRDFAAALIAREQGFRAVSVPEAVCFVPRSTSLTREFPRKTRTMARGLQTLWFKRGLLNPFQYGVFAFMLFSHKLCRWLFQPLSLASLLVLIVLAPVSVLAATIVALAGVASVIGWWGWHWPGGPRWLTMAGFALGVNLAALRAWGRFLRGTANATWEPTKRPPRAEGETSKSLPKSTPAVSRSGESG